MNVSDSPKQILSLPQVIIGDVGFGVTVITLEAFPLHPVVVQVTSKVELAVGETVIDEVVAPLDQAIVPAQFAVNITLSPAHIPSFVAMIVGIAPAPTVTVIGVESLLEHSPNLHTAV